MKMSEAKMLTGQSKVRVDSLMVLVFLRLLSVWSSLSTLYVTETLFRITSMVQKNTQSYIIWLHVIIRGQGGTERAGEDDGGMRWREKTT